MSEVIVVGGGLAGYLTVSAIRQKDASIPITLLSADAGVYYHKPQISSAFTHQKTAHDLIQMDVSALAQKHAIDIQPFTPVIKVDAEHKRIETAESSLPYQHCILACGSLPRPLACEGSGVAYVRHVNHLSEYQRLREDLSQGQRVCIIGGGLVGVEMANDLGQAGFQVHVVHDATWPLQTLLPEKVGQVLAAHLSEAYGVTWHWQTQVKTIERQAQVMQVCLEQATLEVDCVINATGLSANTTLAKQSGLDVQHGIVVDRMLRTSAANVYALGDCAQVDGHRYFYVFPIRHAASALAATITGTPTEVVYPAMPVTLKTPGCPIVICPPPRGETVTWSLDGQGADWSGLALNQSGQAVGFVCCGRSTMAKRAVWAKDMPNWLPRG